MYRLPFFATLVPRFSPLVVSSESAFLTIFVLISQSRMARQSERRSHLDLQVAMLSEQELTTILQMLQKLCQHMGVKVDSSKQEVQSFIKTTDVHKLASELEAQTSGGIMTPGIFLCTDCGPAERP
jgi:uncharacterized membrane protein